VDSTGSERGRQSGLTAVQMGDLKAFWIITTLFSVFTIFLFAPHLRYDSLVYLETARSIVFDQDLNTYNEDAYFTKPGWHDVAKRKQDFQPVQMIHFSNQPVFSSQGYRSTFFPVGSTFYWIIPLKVCNMLMHLDLFSQFPNTGYSLPYILICAFWNALWWCIGVLLCYRLVRIFFSPSESAVSVIAVS